MPNSKFQASRQARAMWPVHYRSIDPTPVGKGTVDGCSVSDANSGEMVALETGMAEMEFESFAVSASGDYHIVPNGSDLRSFDPIAAACHFRNSNFRLSCISILLHVFWIRICK